MALTLPYPDMDFVPLDILTAAEQDQLVANIEYIANQFPVSSIDSNAVDTAQIKNGAVTAAKIDFTTLKINPKFMQTGSGSITYQTQGSGGGGVNVTFPVAFDNAPIVVASTKGPYSANVVEVHAQSASTTGFSILARTAGGTSESGSFQWVAIDLLANPIAGV